MITTILSDFSRVILNPRNISYKGTINNLHKELLGKQDDYSFFDHFEFNDEVLNLYKTLRKKYSVNVFTSGTIQNRSEIRKVIDPIFENVFTAKDYNLDKKQPESYLFIAKKLGKRPQEILFIDDQIDNINAAKKAGLNTILFTDYKNLVLALKKYFRHGI